MRKSVLAASAAVLVLAGIAGADYFRVLKTHQLKAIHSIVVGESVAEPAAGTIVAPAGFVGPVTGNVTGNVTGTQTGSRLGPVPDTQVVAATETIAADACGGIKNISSASAVTTNTTNTFTAPAAGNAGCIMYVCNVNASDAITLDDNALFTGAGVAGATPGDTVLGADDCVGVGSTGSIWKQLGPAGQG